MSCLLQEGNLPQFRFSLNNPEIMDIGLGGADLNTANADIWLMILLLI